MSRRKGERPIPKLLDSWSPEHPVARSIADGSRWFAAWVAQKCTPFQSLSKKTGIETQRRLAIDGGDRVSRAEIDALAIVWNISAGDLIASINKPELVID